jgi:hypothetical protein
MIENITPGPWKAVVTIPTKSHGYLITAPQALGPHNGESEVGTVCGGKIPGRAEANADLIAAAPDLYAALEGLWDATVGAGDLTPALVAKVHAALDRARGVARLASEGKKCPYCSEIITNDLCGCDRQD